MSLTAAASTMFLITNFRMACVRNWVRMDILRLEKATTHLVLGDTLGAVSATDVLDVAPAMLVASVVPPLGCHLLKPSTTIYQIQSGKILLSLLIVLATQVITIIMSEQRTEVFRCCSKLFHILPLWWSNLEKLQ